MAGLALGIRGGLDEFTHHAAILAIIETLLEWVCNHGSDKSWENF